MTDADDLVVWLTGVLVETERVARWAADYAPPDGVWTLTPDPDDLMVTVNGEERVMGFGAAAHIALNDPRAVLARVEAERAVLRLHEAGEYARACQACMDTEPLAAGDSGGADWPCDTLRWIAYGHRFDAPGWQAAWAPEGVRTEATT